MNLKDLEKTELQFGNKTSEITRFFLELQNMLNVLNILIETYMRHMKGQSFDIQSKV